MKKNRIGLTGYLDVNYRLTVYQVLLSPVVRESMPPPIHDAIIALVEAETEGNPNHPKLKAALIELQKWSKNAAASERHRMLSSAGRKKVSPKQNPSVLLGTLKYITLRSRCVKRMVIGALQPY